MSFSVNNIEHNLNTETYSDVPNLQFNKNNYKGNIENKTNLIIRLVSFIAFILFAMNIFLVGFIYYNEKNSLSKNINVNHYNVSVQGDNISTFAVQNAWQSSVCIAAGGYARDEDSFFNLTTSRGSGVILKIIENDVYILTCYHVICGMENSIYILFPTYSIPQNAVMIGYSTKYDIAVLRAKKSQNILNCSEIMPKNSQLLSIGENVFAVGNSLSGGLCATCGIISRLNKFVLVEGNLCREIQTDASINPGNSGGGLFNSEGKFIGLVNAKFSLTSSSNSTSFVEGTAFAIPGTLAISIANSIIFNQGSPRAFNLGVEFESLNANHSISNIDGNLIDDFEVRISQIYFSSVAKNILEEGDVVLSFQYTDIDGNRLLVYMTNEFCFEDICFNIKNNSEIEFEIFRPIVNENMILKIPVLY